MKIPVNQPCPICNSGIKYKKCCGSPANRFSQQVMPKARFPSPFAIQELLKRHKAEELIRQQQQGLGRPMIALEKDDRQFVAVGNTIFNLEKGRTPVDFLSGYLKTTLGPEWGNAEIQKPLPERHTILQWYEEYCHFQREYFDDNGKIQSGPMLGIVYCYIGLAYNLYLLKHNVELQERFLKRLKDQKQFQGTYYELIVANILIRAGFDLVLEDESDLSSKHCEFSAVSKRTGKKYWIEAKMKAVSGFLGKTRLDGSTNKDPTSSMTAQLNEALKKPATDNRIIFIDVNADPSTSKTPPPWVAQAQKRLEAKEKDLLSGQEAYVILTNMPFHRALKIENNFHVGMAFGLGINDFYKRGEFRFSEAYKMKQKHIDIHYIMEALQKYPQLPPTFDGSLPGQKYGSGYDRVTIGEEYLFQNIEGEDVLGTITTAMVNTADKKIYCGITTEKGSRMITKEMSDEELVDYTAHPEAFFGQIRKPSKSVSTPYELFESFVSTYLETPKEKILEFMKDHPDIEVLKQLDHYNLVLEYCERMAGAAAHHMQWEANKD